jgi:hypothetical protein
LVGFYCPAYAGGVNLPGYHLLFISAGRKVGGHLLECRITNAGAVLDATHDFMMVLAQSPEFYRVDLSGNKEDSKNRWKGRHSYASAGDGGFFRWKRLRRERPDLDVETVSRSFHAVKTMIQFKNRP